MNSVHTELVKWILLYFVEQRAYIYIFMFRWDFHKNECSIEKKPLIEFSISWLFVMRILNFKLNEIRKSFTNDDVTEIQRSSTKNNKDKKKLTHFQFDKSILMSHKYIDCFWQVFCELDHRTRAENTSRL